MLSDKQIHIIRIFYQYGCGYAEIADRTGASYSEIRRVIENFKEEINMPRGKRLSDADKRCMVEMYRDGEKAVNIADRFGVAVSCVHRIIAENKNEPVTAATDTSSEQNIIPDNSADIIPENPENVKPPEVNPVEIDMSDTYEGDNVYRDIPIPPKEHTFSTAAVDAVFDCICRKQAEIAELDENMTMLYAEIDRLNEQINALNDMQMYAEAELDRLWKDYEEICGRSI